MRLTCPAVVFLLGCAPTLPVYEGLRPEPECERVRADVASIGDLPEATPLVVRTMTIPRDPPVHLRDRIIQVQVIVSEDGRVVPGSVVIEGSDDRPYNRELVDAAEKWTFAPARYQDCLIARPFSWSVGGDGAGGRT